jgi:Uncharacterized protein conserved in bacteria
LLRHSVLSPVFFFSESAMSEPTITCPNCHTTVRLTESLAAPLVEATRQRYEQQLAAREATFAQRETQLETQAKAMAEREAALAGQARQLQAQVTEQVEAKLRTERERVVAEEARKAKAAAADELAAGQKALAELQEVLKARDAKLAEAQQAQADMLRRQRELEDARRELDLTVEKRVSEGLEAVRGKARQEAEESLRLKVVEKDQMIASMQQKIAELKQRAEQGSQQLQGEAQELDLENTLRQRFAFDTIDPVPKGEFGGDVLHTVLSQSGQVAGRILWESKRTRNWSEGWLEKLRNDQRAAKADVAILVSQALPKEIETFDVREGVWVTGPRTALAVANLLRTSILQVHQTRLAGEGLQGKAELVYQYLTGPHFRHRVSAIREAFDAMQDDLDRERKLIQKQWAKRQAQIDRMVAGMTGMYGDLQGIAGAQLPEIEGMGFEALEGPEEE